MHHMVLASVDEGWSLGGSILTFLVPMLAFIAIGATLLILYTKPELVPGRGKPDDNAAVTANRHPGLPVTSGQAAKGSGETSDGSGTAGKSGEPVSAE